MENEEREESLSLTLFSMSRRKALIKLRSCRKNERVRRERLSLKLAGRSWPVVVLRKVDRIRLMFPTDRFPREKRRWKRGKGEDALNEEIFPMPSNI